MRHGIVEGEPGMFPDPIARLFVAISRFLRRRSGAEKDAKQEPPEAPRGDKGDETGAEPPAAPGA
jgi:hypothetical protein